MFTSIEWYLADGCMHCKYRTIPQCEINRWRGGLVALRQIVLLW